MTELEQHIKEQYPFRFYLLKGMCLLTAIFTVAAIFLVAIALAGGKFNYTIFTTDASAASLTQLFLAILLNSLSLLGIYLMWTLRKVGFYLFFVSRVLLYYLPVIFISTAHPALTELFVSALVIVLFGINLGIMKR